MNNLLIAPAIMVGIGLFFGTVLAIAQRFLKVEEDPRIEGTNELLPGTNCGACGQPGSGVAASGLTPGGLVGFAASPSNAGTTLNAGPCGQVTTGLGLPITVIALINADANGFAAVMPPNGIPAIACGWYLQVLDLASCTTTPMVQL